MSIAEKLTTIAENQQRVYEAGKAAGGGVKTCSIDFYEYIGCFSKVILTCVEDGAIVEKVFDGIPQEGLVGNVLAGSLIVAIITDDYATDHMDDDFVPLLTDYSVEVPDDPDGSYVLYIAKAPSNPADNYDYSFHI